MQTQATKASLMHTLRAFWTGKRFLKLFLFALLLGDLTYYCVSMLAKQQLIHNVVRRHDRIYYSYLQVFEQLRRLPSTESSVTASAPAQAAKDSGADPSLGGDQANSAYWSALRELRRQNPQMRLDIIVQGTVGAEREARVMEALRAHMRDWLVTDEREGSVHSFYLLPTRVFAAFQVTTDAREDFAAWERTSIVMGGYAFILLLAFGWFWTRALDEGDVASRVSKDKIREIYRVMSEISAALEGLQNSLADLEREQGRGIGERLRGLNDNLAQIRLFAVNGSIEAARSAETYRVFSVLMQEINQLATSMRDQVKALDDGRGGVAVSTSELQSRITQLRSKLSHEAGDFSREAASSPTTTFRRVG